MNEYSGHTPTDLMALIDEKFEESVGETKRLDLKWGLWSREMNLEIKDRMKDGSSDTMILGQIFSYWIILSQLLDLIYDCKGLKRFLLEKKIKAKTEEAMMIRERIDESS